MTDNKLSKIVSKADEILKEHGSVYLERRLYTTLKKDFPDLSKADLKEVLDELTKEDYKLERGLIKPQLNKESKNKAGGKRTGKGSSDTLRIPDKRL
ncbi:MAG: hypothetical protein ACPK7O_05865 [Methanobacterium sp.]